MRDPRITEQLHLLLRRAHEEETTRIKQENRQVLETVRVLSVLADGVLVAQDEANLDEPRQPRRHERVSEYGVHHRTQHQTLRVRTHGPAGEQNDDAGDEVARWPAVAVAR